MKKTEITEKQALSKLMALCARSEHSSGDMLQKMRLWGLDEAAQARIMERLVSGKFIDDERFTRAFVNDKIKRSGRRALSSRYSEKSSIPSMKMSIWRS